LVIKKAVIKNNGFENLLSDFLFMSVFSESFLSFVRRHFMTFSFFTAGHN